MLPDIVAALSGSGLEDGAGDPSMALVVDGIRFLQKWEAAVLWLKSGLQVRAVVDGVRPGITGEQFEAFGHAFLHVDGERVVPGAGIGKLRVNAVERHRHAEADRIVRQMSESNLVGVTASGRSKGRVWPGRPEEIEERWCSDEADGRERIAIGCGETLTERAGRNQGNT